MRVVREHSEDYRFGHGFFRKDFSSKNHNSYYIFSDYLLTNTQTVPAPASHCLEALTLLEFTAWF